MHNTPSQVSDILARHIPKNAVSVLDPAVGHGALIAAIHGRLNGSLKKIVCIDINKASVNYVQKTFEPLFNGNLTSFEGDFLEISDPLSRKRLPNFDCIVMNPPFCGKLNEWVKFDLFHEKLSVRKDVRMVPLEAAFFLRAVGVLKSGGRLLAIVPSSLISSEKMLWLRRLILELGSILYVHELPRKLFKRFAGRVYVLVFKKTERQKDLVVLNHDLNHPHRLVVKRESLLNDLRFDYSYYSASLIFKKLRSALGNIKWIELKEIADIYRGGTLSPLGARKAIHTTNNDGGIWKGPGRKVCLLNDSSIKGIKKADILIRRVGRSCSQSAGMAINLAGYACSDCVLIIRPKNAFSSLETLFALRFLLCSCRMGHLLERGTGASYVTKTDLSELTIPIGISRKHPVEYDKFKYAVRHHSLVSLRSIEDRLSSIYSRVLFNKS